MWSSSSTDDNSFVISDLNPMILASINEIEEHDKDRSLLVNEDARLDFFKA